MGPGTILLRDIAERGAGLTVTGGATLREMIRQMTENEKGVLILLQGKRAVGILTERDVVRIMFSGTSLEEIADRIARKPLVTANGERTIGYALNVLVGNNVRRLVVVDNSGNFLGIVTHKDLLKHLEEDYYRSTLKVKHIFDNLKSLVSIGPADRIADVLRKMVDHKISAVPIVEKGIPIGIITEKDILRLADEGV